MVAAGVRHSLVRLDAACLSIYEWGDADRPAVLAWHGLGGSGLRFNEIAPALTAEFGLRVVALDAPGFGRSPALPPDAYAEPRLADLAAQLLTALDIDRAAFIGHSWGAEIACHFAARHPERTTAVVLLDWGHVDDSDLEAFGIEPELEKRIAAIAARPAESYASWDEFLDAVRTPRRRSPALDTALRASARRFGGRITLRCPLHVRIAIERAPDAAPRTATYPRLHASRTPVLLLLASEPPD